MNDEVVNAPNNDFCSDDNVCNGVETCDPVNDCTNPADLVCNDGLFCNGAETCDPIAGCQDGADPVINDGVDCTDDSCDEVNDEVVNAPNNDFCSDDNVCNGVETCDPVNDCTNPADLVCNDGLFCNGAETCDAIAGCQDGADPVINDGVDCTDDSCDEVNDEVVNAPNNDFCSDDNVCNGVETCDPVNDCTNPADLVCNDGLFCNGAETCDPIAGCQDGADPVINDGVDCTDDSCDEVNDEVVNAPNNDFCSDDNVCNGVETCDPVNDCTNPADLVCNDGLFCNGAETCDPIAGCQDGADPVINDGVDCTDDSCDEVNDEVVNAPNNDFCSDDNVCNGVETCDPVNDCTNPADLVCNDGLFCNGAETCDAIAGCQDGADPVINDGVDCTDDSCDEVNDEVVNAPNNDFCSDDNVCNGVETCDPVNDCTNPADLVCNDGLFCNGAETCDPIAGCQDGADPVINDGVDCTDDSCDEVNDEVVNAPNNDFCSDDNVCNGVETCDPVNGCTNPADLVCNDGLFCNGAETCDPIAGCQDGADPVINDGVDCTDDSCDEVNDEVVNAPNNDFFARMITSATVSRPAIQQLVVPIPRIWSAMTDCSVMVPRPAMQSLDARMELIQSLNDGVDCTDDSCDEVNDEVVNAPNNDFFARMITSATVSRPAIQSTIVPIPLTWSAMTDCSVMVPETCDPIAGCQDGADPVIK